MAGRRRRRVHAYLGRTSRVDRRRCATHAPARRGRL